MRLLRGLAHASSITMRMLHLSDEESAQRQLIQLAEEQAALRRVATLVAGGASPPETFSAVAAEIGQLLGADVTMVLRYEPDGTGTVIGGWSVPGARSSVASPIVAGGRLWGAISASMRRESLPTDTEQPPRS